MMRDNESVDAGAHLALLDWRRRVHSLYGRVRATWALDPAAAHDLWRSERDTLFARHQQSPIPAGQRPAFRGLAVAAYDPQFAFLADVDRDVAPERYEIPRSSGGTTVFVRFATVSLPLGTLDLFWLDAYGGGVFLPLRDATSGTTTYGGGRYLLDTVKGADLGPDGTTDRLLLDFNFAYHPSCHYDARWSCPLAPPANWLDAAVTAGEQA